jgi:hypothetical protein
MIDWSPLYLVNRIEPAACLREKIMEKVKTLFPEDSLKWDRTKDERRYDMLVVIG